MTPSRCFIRRADAERFIEDVPAATIPSSELASYLRIEERELDAGALN